MLKKYMNKNVFKIIGSILFISYLVLNFFNFKNKSIHHIFSMENRLLIFGITTLLFIYSRKLNKKHQYAHATINTEKKEKDLNSNEFFTKPKVTFEDVAGLEEIKEELSEVIDFINQSEKYHKMGAKIPKGILFYGPPGTGKTLLASAVAGETKSAFFSASGSEFVEKYVGVGAKRVRTLFEKARKEAPSVIFIDEIDAIGAKRHIDSNNEKDQTLNQLLVELDGFNTDQTVVVIAATIESHDLSVKANNASKFLKSGDKVKVSMKFRGRELANTAKGQTIIKQFASILEEFSVVEKEPKLEGKQLIMILAPKNA